MEGSGYRLIWQLSHRADPKAKELADRHYNRQKPDSPQFVPPGRCCVLYARTETGRAFWVTSAPFGQYVKHRWPGAWVCSAFRNENAGVASDIIVQAISATCYLLGEPPPLGMVTFIDRRFVVPVMVRGRQTWGRTYVKAGFEPDGETRGGLLAFRLAADRFPPADRPIVINGMQVVMDRILAKRPDWI